MPPALWTDPIWGSLYLLGKEFKWNLMSAPHRRIPKAHSLFQSQKVSLQQQDPSSSLSPSLDLLPQKGQHVVFRSIPKTPETVDFLLDQDHQSPPGHLPRRWKAKCLSFSAEKTRQTRLPGRDAQWYTGVKEGGIYGARQAASGLHSGQREGRHRAEYGSDSQRKLTQL